MFMIRNIYCHSDLPLGSHPPRWIFRHHPWRRSSGATGLIPGNHSAVLRRYGNQAGGGYGLPDSPDRLLACARLCHHHKNYLRLRTLLDCWLDVARRISRSGG